MNRTTAMLAGAAAVVVLGWVVLTVTSGGGEADVTSPTGDTLDGVCDTLRAASQLDADPEKVFYDRAHEGLHGLASSAATTDRVAAGDLLRAKRRVEAAFEEQLPREQTIAILRHLFATAGQAATIVDPSIQGSCSA